MSPSNINISEWIECNKKYFLPPVCNKMMHGEGQLKIFYVGGPNLRKDFHLEEGEELFYMVKGDMNLITLEKNKFKNVHIKQGEVFLLPGRIPHSPQRGPDTIGLVIERERLKQETDCLRYFVGETTDILYEKWFYCEDLGTQLGPVIKMFFQSEQYKTGKPIPGDITTDPPYFPDPEKALENPFLLDNWVKEHREEIDSEGSKKLFHGGYQSDIQILGQSTGGFENKEVFEVWLWQIEGSSVVKIKDEEIELKPHDSYLVKSNTPFQHIRPSGCIAMSVKMDPKRNTKLGMKK